MKNHGTYNAGIINSNNFNPSGKVVRMTDSAIASGAAFLMSELEKRDLKLREPLTSVTYTRDIPVKTGGGWVETISALNIDYGIANSSHNGPVLANGANTVPVVQANLGKDIFGTHVFSTIMRIGFIDMQKENFTGRSLDKMLQDGVRLVYDKHMDANVYVGMTEYGSHGLVNNPNVVVSTVAAGTSTKTNWTTKTPDEILADINTAITETWESGGYDLKALPNHIILPYAQYNYIATTKVSALAEKTILSFVLENNVAAKNGKELIIGATAYCKDAGAATDSNDRMVCYVHDDNFLAVEELVPLSRTMTQPNIDALAYDSVYMANISDVEFFYNQTIRYYDGI